MKKSIFFSLVAMLLIFFCIYFIAFSPLFAILNGYTAKRVCSSHFIAERTLESIEENDMIFPATWSSSTIDQTNRIVHSSVLGIAKQTAKFRKGFGCTILPKDYDLKPVPALRESIGSNDYWAERIRDHVNPLNNVDYASLNKTVDESFGTADRTRAVLVLHKGNLIAEKYHDDFDKDIELLGWSMTKSITNNLIGILVKQGKLSLNQNALVPEWQDERANITIENLLGMATDLEWNEEYGYLSDVTRMLYLQNDASTYAIDKGIKNEIGTSFVYSSGTTNIISQIIKSSFKTEEEYLNFPHHALFDKLGIDATVELDADNNFVLSSYSYMTARSWAKLGQFWLQKGAWEEEQILPDGWIDYSTTTGAGINGLYGAHFWLNTNSGFYPDVPGDMYSARGFQGQQVIVVPSKETVIVRFGVDEAIESFDFNSFISSILTSINN